MEYPSVPLVDNEEPLAGFGDNTSIQTDFDDSKVLNLQNVLGSASCGTANSSVEQNRTSVPQQGTSWYAAVFLVVNAALGAGLLNFPQAFAQAGGILMALVIQGILLIFIIGGLVILAYCSDKKGSSTYQGCVSSICGKIPQKLCAITIVLYCYGTCITFFIIIGDQYDRALSSLYGHTFCHFWYMDRRFTMSVSSILFILPLCFSKRIDFLKYASSCGIFAMLYVVFLITYKYYEGKYTPGPIDTLPGRWTDVFLVIPVICFSYQCHVSCIPIYYCFKERNLKNFMKTISVAIIIAVVTYTDAATYGFLTFGSSVASDVIESYDAKDAMVLVAIIAIAVKTYTTYPILLFCGRVAVNDLYIAVMKITPELAERGELRRRVIIAIFWFASSLILAVFIPDIGVVIQMLGSLAALFIFIFPGMCLLQESLSKDPYYLKRNTKLRVLLSAVFLTLGAAIFGLVFSQSIRTDISNTQAKGIALCY